MSESSRILFYSHDTFGLGHIRRTQKIANALSKSHRSILIACSSPKASSYSSQPGIEYLNLPGFAKQPKGDYLPRSLRIPMDEFTNIRSQLMLAAARSFRPDVIVVDKEPLGVKNELFPMLDFVRSNTPKTQVICGLRDILDEPAAVHEEWRRRDTIRSLRRFYDHILVYGEKRVYDMTEEYKFPADLKDKVRFTGFLHPAEFPDQLRTEFSFSHPERPLITLTLGGGGDGAEVLGHFLDYLEQSDHAPDYNYILLTGPFIATEVAERARKLASFNPHVIVKDFVPRPVDVFMRSHLVISMGGYNTMCELASLGVRPLILPRVKPRKEQLIRAQAFQKSDLCDYLVPEDISVQSLAQQIQSKTEKPQRTTPLVSVGLDSIVQFISQLENR